MKADDPKFKIPDHYFEDFNDRLFAKLSEVNEAPDTSFLPKHDGFQVPQGYFKKVTTVVMEHTHQGKSKVIAFNKQFMIYWAAAAVAVLLVLGVVWKDQHTATISFEDLANSDIDNYLEDNGLYLTTEELVAAVDEENLLLSEIDDERLEADHIMDYLDENLGDVEDLNLDYEELDY